MASRLIAAVLARGGRAAVAEATALATRHPKLTTGRWHAGAAARCAPGGRRDAAAAREERDKTAGRRRRSTHTAETLTAFIHHADLRQDPHGQDDHARRRAVRHDRQRETEDPGQGGHPARPAALDFRGQAARGRPHAQRLQHPEGVDAPPRLHRRLRLRGGGKKRKKKTYTKPKKTPHVHKKDKLRVLRFYKIEDDGKVTRLRKYSPVAGTAGCFMAASTADRRGAPPAPRGKTGSAGRGTYFYNKEKPSSSSSHSAGACLKPRVFLSLAAAQQRAAAPL